MRIRRKRGSSAPHKVPGRPRFPGGRGGRRLDGAASACLALLIVLPGACMVARALADGTASASPAAPHYNLPKSFKGHLPITELTENQAIFHALNRLAYGPRPGEVERIRKMGLENRIQQQLHYEYIDHSDLTARLAPFPTLRMSGKERIEKYPPPLQAAKRMGLSPQDYRQRLQQELRAKRRKLREQGVDPSRIEWETLPGPQRIVAEVDLATLDRAVYDPRQLYEVMANFWFNHFNVNARKGAELWLLTDYVQNTIRPHAMGKFENLLVATAKSPAMLFYLDNWVSVDPAAFKQLQAEIAARRRRLQARFGAMRMPGDRQFPEARQFPGVEAARARPKEPDRGLNENYGREIMELHTVGVSAGYTQQDVIEMADCLTGWTIRAPRRDPHFFFDDRLHDRKPKVVMGHEFDYGGMKDGLAALHMLATSPATARHISFELAQHFVSDYPPPALVERMAQSFLSSGGDIRAVLKTMIYSPEFWSRQAYQAKIKTPFELVVSAVRALDARTAISLPLVQWVARMGEPLYLCEPPTGYGDTADVWVNSGSLLNRMNFALALGTNHIPGATADLSALLGPGAGANPQLALSRALHDFLHGQLSAKARQTLENQLGDPEIMQAERDDPVQHAREGLLAGLVLGSPEFQRR